MSSPFTADCSQDESGRLDPLERATLQDKILIQLKEKLIFGHLKPGQKLTLRALATQLGTSLMPVRDAIQHLESIGVLVAQPNRTLVIPLLSETDLQELSEVRLTLECMAAARASALASPAGLASLRRCLDALGEARGPGSRIDYLRAHWDFHLQIAILAESPTLVATLKSLWLKIGPTIQMSDRMIGDRLEAIAFHQAIAEAIERNDPAAAAKALEADIFYTFGRQNLGALRAAKGSSSSI